VATFAWQSEPNSPPGILATLPDAIPECLVVWTVDGRVVEVNRRMVELLGWERSRLVEEGITLFWPDAPLGGGLGEGIHRSEGRWRTALGGELPMLISTTRAHGDGGDAGYMVSVALDLSERKRLEVALLNARKLESVGQLAAGIAHELNTPIQFVYDNTFFLVEAFEDLQACVKAYRAALDAASAGCLRDVDRLAVSVAEEQADLEFLFAEIPDALARVKDGAERVARIVRAMKAFAHPRQALELVDLNAELDTTLVIARNEYKYVAEVEFERGDLPPLLCDAGALNQVFLNLIVNAAHAIEDRQGGRGLLRITTGVDGDFVWIAFADDGCGIPATIRDRIFDPFFTTKAVGRGSGQGLALAYQVVVEQHHGRIDVDSEVGRGTTFHLRLPLGPRRTAEGRF